MPKSLLPPNATQLERDIEQVTAAKYDMPVPIRDIWNADTCPSSVLPWLAWAMSVEPWDADWSEQQQRQVIKASIGLHAQKGTVAAVRQVLQASGLGDAVVLERLHKPGRSGNATRNGHYYYGWAKAWARYRIILQQPITQAKAVFVRRLLAEAARASSVLDALDFTAVAHNRNGAIAHDGINTRGVI